MLSFQECWQLSALFQGLLVETHVYLLTGFSYSLICLESRNTAPLSMEARTFQGELAGRSPQSRGGQAAEGEREGERRIPIAFLCTGPCLPTLDPRDPSTDNKLATKGLWLHVF